MIVKAEQTYSRQTATRLRLVASAIKKLSLKDAMDQLEFLNKKAAGTLLKVMKQAVANATHNMNVPFESLTIKDIVVNEGPHFKRFQPVSRGRAHSILKRTAHIRVLLETQEAGKEIETKADEKSEVKNDEKTEKVVAAAKTTTKKSTVKKAVTSKKKTTAKTKKTGDK